MAPRIDLYSDTHTKPTPEMRQAMMEAEVGDEQQFEDPTVNKLCEMVAALLGQEAAVFLPSGTMCNQIAFRVHCQPGDEIILDYPAHPINAESGGPSAVAGAQTRALHTKLGIFTADQVRDAIRPIRRHLPVSRVISIEKTTNAGGGSVWPIEEIISVTQAAKENGLSVSHIHLKYINPFPKNLGEILVKYDKILIPELNMGQLLSIIRAKYLVDAKGYNSIKGKPFTSNEVLKEIKNFVKD